MKKILFTVLVFFMFILSGCGLSNNNIPNENSIFLMINDDFIDYLDYDKLDIPNYTLNFEGTIYTNAAVKNKNEVVFSGNDDFVVSDMIANLLDEYQNIPGRFSSVVVKEEKQFETRMNSVIMEDGERKFQKHFLKVEDGKIYNEYAFITLDNGLQLTIEYRRFNSIDENNKVKTYYAWQYTASIRMFLHYPLMVIKKEGGVKKLLILPLPNGVMYTVGTQLSLVNIISKDKDDKYLNDTAYRSFPYINYSDEPNAPKIDLNAEIALIKDYYNNNFSGYVENDDYYFIYLNKVFKVIFNQTSFTLEYVNEYI